MIRNKLSFQRPKKKNVESVGGGSEAEAHGDMLVEKGLGQREDF